MLAEPPEDTDTARRVEHVLAAGRAHAIVGIIVDATPPGAASIRMRTDPDGAVFVTNTDHGSAPHGAQLYTMHANQARHLLEQITHPHSLTETHEPTPEYTAEQHENQPPPDQPPQPDKQPPDTESARDESALDGSQRAASGPAHGVLDVTESLPTESPEPSRRGHLQLQVLGPVRLWWVMPALNSAPDAQPPRREIPVSPRGRELLIHLALHRDGVRRETIAEAMWPDAASADHINTAITRLRRVIIEGTGEQFRRVITSTAGRCGLDANMITIDLWQFRDAIEQSRDLDGDAFTPAYRTALEHYTGALADGIDGYPLDAERQTILRHALTTATHLADVLTTTTPEAAPHVLDQARAIAPYDEPTYRHIMRIQTQLHRPDAVQRTYQLLTDELETLGATPHPDTTALLPKKKTMTHA